MVKKLKGFPENYPNFDWNEDLFMFTIGLPFECNYRCPKCAFSESKSDSSIPLERKINLLREAGNLGAKVFLVTGEGEPLISKEFEPLIKTAHDQGLVSVVFSNASHLDDGMIQFCYNNDVTLILSIDSLKEGTYDFLTGTKGNFTKVMENFNRTRPTYRASIEKIGNDTVLRLALNTVTTIQNKNEITSIKELCGEDILFICNAPVYSGDAIQNWKALTGVDASTNEGLYNPELAEIRDRYTERPKQTFTRPQGGCASLLNGIELGSDGHAIICAGGRKRLLGDANNKSLSEIWMRKKQLIQDYKLNEVACLPRSPDLYQKVLKELEE